MLGRKSMRQRLLDGLIQASNQYRYLSLAIAALLAATVLTGPLVSLSIGGLQWPALGSWIAALLLVAGFAAFAGPLLGIIFDLRRGWWRITSACAGAGTRTIVPIRRTLLGIFMQRFSERQVGTRSTTAR